MRVVILTQDDPFYLGEQIEYLIQNISGNVQIVGCVVFDVSPFGKRESTIRKSFKTLNIFGLRFFTYYSFEYLKSKIISGKKVKNVLNKYNIPLIQIDGSVNSIRSLIAIKSYNPDLLISIAGNQIFKKDIIDLAPSGCLNLHSALLPKYRGLMPSFWVLKNNERYTGVSVFFVDEGIDSGPILVQKQIKMGDMTQEQLISVSKRVGMDAIIEAINLIQSGNYSLIPNPNDKSSYYSFPTKKDVQEFRDAGKKFY